MRVKPVPPKRVIHAAPDPLKAVSRKRARWSNAGLPEVMLRIRSCESGPNGYATGGRAHDYDYGAENAHSSASGAWQFLAGTWRSTSKKLYGYALPAPAGAHSRAVQDAVAMKLYRASGTSPWNASRSCWGRG